MDLILRISGRQYVADGCMLPSGYGVAWIEPWSDRCVAMPVPLNIVASWLRAAWIWLKQHHAPDMIADAYNRGRSDGYEVGMGSRMSYERMAAVTVLYLLRDEYPEATQAIRRRLMES